MQAPFDAFRGLELTESLEKQTATNRLVRCNYLCTTPPQWLAGLIIMCHATILWERPAVILPPSAPRLVTTDYVDRIHQLGEVDGGFYPPSLLRDLCTTGGMPLERLKSLKFVNFAGAPLEDWVGDPLCASIPVASTYVSTKMGFVPLYWNEGLD